ncbi:MAG: SUF system NifU family Fe-S cluster assembly protein [Treponema sp.]
MSIETVYQQTLLDYSRRMEHKHELIKATGAERGHNPSCGDDLTLLIKEKEGIIEEASFLGVGCAVSTASTNMLIELITGKSVDEARELVEIFFTMMAQKPQADSDLDKLGDAQILGYFAEMPARIKCATLSWHSAKVLLK